MDAELTSNRIIAALPPAECAALVANAHVVPLRRHEVLHHGGPPARLVCFPLAGMVAITVALEEGANVNTLSVGPNGVVGLPALFAMSSIGRSAIVELPGQALALSSATLTQIASPGSRTHTILERYSAWCTTVLAQSVACAVGHRVAHRCARLLLEAHDATEGDDIDLTQANVAEFLGVRRASASVALEALERDGAVALRRSCITVVDLKRLNAAACSCHQVVAELYPSIFAHG